MELSAWIDRHADFTPDKTALHYEGRAISYGDFAAMIHGHARALKGVYGIGRGDRVAYLGLNSPEFLALMFACARLGALFIPLNWRLAAPEHVFILKDAHAKALFCEAEFREHAKSMRAELPDCDFVSCGFEGEGWQPLAVALATAEGDDRNPHVDLKTPLLLVYTSGTTGHPKGAVLTQEAVQWNALNSLHMHGLTAADHVLTALPMFHVGGLNIQTTPALYAGATVTLHRKFDPRAVLSDIVSRRPSLIVLVPATIDAVLSLPEWPEADISSLRSVSTGSSYVPVPLIEAIHARGIPVLQVYGSTETCPIAIYQRAEDAFETVGSTGKPALHCEIRVVDEAGRDVPAGTSGEILVRGPSVMYEYWGNEAATEQSLRDGWFFTGDIGYREENGYYFINDRKKDVVISGGENIYPAELEVVLNGMAEVKQAAVVGRDDEKWGQVPVAVVVRTEGASIDKQTILDRFNGVLARFKHPKDVVFIDAMPTNVMGKIQKFALRTHVNDSYLVK
ncbi:class I adenylate-forming enzyme family protein [Roseibium aggregatum]|uniref:3-methylmercaptopropionyl-CoA ligase n=1 Tax=Roseibium aggregatum TaxID=187304 RepID=A0A926P599_9HYPH|nr:AMP-binding protein [Roseibium aggregatum]MBD1548111.1 AMP-binding protein [Roseibium aggregatum]